MKLGLVRQFILYFLPPLKMKETEPNIQGVVEMRAQILITSYWLHVELGKNI
jgi:hypothetical protein